MFPIYYNLYPKNTKQVNTLHSLSDKWTNSNATLLLCHRENFWLALGLAKLGVMCVHSLFTQMCLVVTATTGCWCWWARNQWDRGVCVCLWVFNNSCTAEQSWTVAYCWGEAHLEHLYIYITTLKRTHAHTHRLTASHFPLNVAKYFVESWRARRHWDTLKGEFRLFLMTIASDWPLEGRATNHKKLLIFSTVLSFTAG